MYEKIFFEAWKEQFVIKTMYLDFEIFCAFSW